MYADSFFLSSPLFVCVHYPFSSIRVSLSLSLSLGGDALPRHAGAMEDDEKKQKEDERHTCIHTHGRNQNEREHGVSNCLR